MIRWRAAANCRFALLGDGWVAYSGRSGETHLLNEESVAVVQVLRESGPLTMAEVCDRLSEEFDTGREELLAILENSWSSLVDAGLLHAEDVVTRV